MFVIVTSEQASIAEADSNQVAISASLAGSLHARITGTGQVRIGLTVSSMVNVACVVLVFPQSSVAVNVIVLSPVNPQRLLKPESKS